MDAVQPVQQAISRLSPEERVLVLDWMIRGDFDDEESVQAEWMCVAEERARCAEQSGKRFPASEEAVARARKTHGLGD